ncbi:MAG: MoaD/ThiS family protein [Candidatus Aenigmarchaeota archaeon]|nr:MoaD/ThiS family protein [Candidatus Aenigmarchaeota archaeon]
MRVHAIRQGKQEAVDLPKGSTVKDLLGKLGVNPETVLTARGERIILETAPLQAGDRIELIRVISGG